MTKKPKTRAGVATRPGSTAEDLMQELRDTGAKVRMRIVVEIDVDDDSYSRDTFNEHVIETVRGLEEDNRGEIVFLTTEELVKP